MTFTVIVPFYNAEAHLRACTESILAQDFDPADYEVLFVDNASTDRSAAIVREYPRITLLEEPLPGPYACRNRAARQARGRIVAFTDADRTVSREWLKEILKGMDATPPADIALGAVSFPASAGSARLLSDYDNAKIRYVLGRGRAANFYGYTGNMAVRKSTFGRVGYFEEWDRSADTKFVQDYAAKTHEFRIVYLERMAVAHLEIRGAGDWLKKMRTYTAANRKVEKSGYQELTLAARLRVFFLCVRTNGYPFPKALELFGLLVRGSADFLSGWIEGRKRDSYGKRRR